MGTGMNLSLSQIAAAVGGRLIGPDATVTGPVVTDSRQASPGALFVAVHGERTDGHAHLGSAGALGAVGAIVSDLKAARTGLSVEPAEAAESEDLPMGLVLVEDTVVALGALARTHLAGLRQGAVDRGERLTVVAMTGSVGKTTTKDLTRQLLAASGPTVAPRASFNNEIGLPLTVLEADESTRYLVLEMGASGSGHIAYLTDIAPLDAAGVLMIGHAHMGGFGSIEGVAAAKAEIIAGLLPEGTAILNADDARCAAMAELAPARVLTFSAQGEPADLQAENVVLDEAACAAFDLHLPGLDVPRRVQLAVAGAHNVANALAAAGLALAAGLEPELIAERLGSVSIESPHRMDVSELSGDLLLIDDSYNANIDSMTAALAALPALAGSRRRVVVVSEMLELGESSAADHARTGELAAQAGAAMLIGIGSTQEALDAARARGVEVVGFEDSATAISQIDALLSDGDAVLVKGSNGSGAWRLADHLKEVRPR
ncbi:UDP-N-acetylmuramoyl-tripeptide--D-alanyl-D-alanine ligase [Actinomyces naeslundii]|uniref:UDP-N-acetylmuramoyl-tripeptide--D-alanyl-D-alanine ligase n=2 Tax=Actinomyces naeslundii TaxID=1655 RepID=A0A854D7N7_ACTNA|nr:UDP-N-acetylmuramoyl-tripeptide--D-alanyl-D-alanine ligase [Actinomyces naeslundii]OMG26326.1 UDP-N-acetylmuramoyl-tripeptide--D-alanyl-D-alanine ligase [Actinomyces naeslundii]OMG32309.1 UDP-N-acetylmuramoyl-tripeptide--D-alanyl-D-alanine ligase [Actinomyces naeslundii]QQC21111.1 UDP-N-acetylmuramoyl-tripeptide--D-alanyl-D-alanine ligase [Actinomyces naeslundii]